MNYLERCFDKNTDIVSRKIADEVILVPIRQDIGDLTNIYTLNEVGSFIWELIDGKNQVKEINDIIVKIFKVSRDEAEEDLIEFIKQLEESKLVKSISKICENNADLLSKEYTSEKKTYKKPIISKTKIIEEGKAFYGALAESCCSGSQRCPSKCTYFI